LLMVGNSCLKAVWLQSPAFALETDSRLLCCMC